MKMMKKIFTAFSITNVHYVFFFFLIYNFLFTWHIKILTPDLNIFVAYSKFMLGICSLEHFNILIQHINIPVISREISAGGHTENLL